MRIVLTHSLIAAATIGASCLAAGPVQAISSDVSVTIQTLQTGPYLPGIPVLLEVQVINTGGEALSIPGLTLSGRDNPYNSVDILTGHNGAPPARVEYVEPNFTPWKSGISPTPPPAIALQPGETKVITAALSYNWRPEHMELLVAEGTLQVQAALCDYGPDAEGNPGIDHNNCLSSNILNLVIVPPAEAEAKAWESAKQTDRPWLLAHPAALKYVTQDADFRRFQAIANLGGNAYSRHASAVVAYMYAKGNALDLNPGRPPQPQVAKQWLDKAMGTEKTQVYLPDWKALAEHLAATAE